MQNLKRNDINELTKQKETHRLTERTYGCQVGEGWEEGIVREFGINMYTLLYLSWITKKDLLFNTRNPDHCYVPAWIGVWGRIDPCMWMAESICCPPETIITLLISYTPIQNKKLKKKKYCNPDIGTQATVSATPCCIVTTLLAHGNYVRDKTDG